MAADVFSGNQQFAGRLKDGGSVNTAGFLENYLVVAQAGWQFQHLLGVSAVGGMGRLALPIMESIEADPHTPQAELVTVRRRGAAFSKRVGRRPAGWGA